MLTSLVFVPVTFWFREVNIANDKTVCTLVFPKSDRINYSFFFVIPLVLIACLLPMLMLVYHYQRIFQKILSTRGTWAASCVVVSSAELKGCPNRDQIRRQSELSITDILAPWPRKFSTNSQFSGSPNGRHGSLSHHEELRLNKHIRVVRVLFLNVIVVLFMWLPITVVMMLIFVDGRRANEDTDFFMRSQYFVVSLIIAFLNTVVNPLLYGVLSDNFRSCLLKMWCLKVGDDHPKLTKENVTPTSGRNVGISSKTSRKQSYVNSISESPNDIV